MSYKKIILEHYKKQAEEFKTSELSTTPDRLVRKMEVDAILSYIEYFYQNNILSSESVILDIGCGNGYTLNEIRKKYNCFKLMGIDFTKEMAELAANRNIANCDIIHGDIKNINIETGSVDMIISERCLINIMNWDEQKMALNNLHRICKKDSYIILIEGFMDAMELLNSARNEFNLKPIPVPYHNLFFNKELLFEELKNNFLIITKDQLAGFTSFLPDYNFMSSHYYMSRVIHPFFVENNKIPEKRNSLFVNFFCEALKPVGNFSFVQLFLLKNKE